MSEEVEYYLEQLHDGQSQGIYFSLIELDDSFVPELIDAFNQEPDPEIQALLVEVIWQHRLPETLEFLRQALSHPDAEIWKNALDGIVAINHSDGLNVLDEEIERLHIESPKNEQIEWFVEARQQLQENLDQGLAC